jgi:hypothetical protein
LISKKLLYSTAEENGIRNGSKLLYEEKRTNRGNFIVTTNTKEICKISWFVQIESSNSKIF